MDQDAYHFVDEDAFLDTFQDVLQHVLEASLVVLVADNQRVALLLYLRANQPIDDYFHRHFHVLDGDHHDQPILVR